MNIDITLIDGAILTPVWNSDATPRPYDQTWLKLKTIRDLYSMTRDGSIAAREIHQEQPERSNRQMANRLTAKDIQHIPDGTWIETDSQLTHILRTWDMNEPRPKGVYLWRWKQLCDQLNHMEHMAKFSQALNVEANKKQL